MKTSILRFVDFVCVAVAMFALTTGYCCMAAEFSVNNYGVAIQGRIEKGDYQKFRNFLHDGDNLWRAHRVFLESPGGNVAEALMFANLFEKSFTSTYVVGTCNSACFIMWAGGVERTLIGAGSLGVHRISVSNPDADLRRIKNLVSPVARDVSAYLSDLGIPRAVIDKMNETPASSIFKIDHFNLQSSDLYKAMSYQPAYLDVVEQFCGPDPDPYAGMYIREKTRDSGTIDAIKKWADCMSDFRQQNRSRFFDAERRALVSDKPTILFLGNRKADVKRILYLR